jgi:hypothetical protein
MYDLGHCGSLGSHEAALFLCLLVWFSLWQDNAKPQGGTLASQVTQSKEMRPQEAVRSESDQVKKKKSVTIICLLIVGHL